jgi:hypothetical protein
MDSELEEFKRFLQVLKPGYHAGWLSERDMEFILHMAEKHNSALWFRWQAWKAVNDAKL